MEHVLCAIAFLNWERNLAYEMGMTHGAMKDLVMKRVIKPGMNLEEAERAFQDWKIK